MPRRPPPESIEAALRNWRRQLAERGMVNQLRRGYSFTTPALARRRAERRSAGPQPKP